MAGEPGRRRDEATKPHKARDMVKPACQRLKLRKSVQKRLTGDFGACDAATSRSGTS